MGVPRSKFKLKNKNFKHTVVDACKANEIKNWFRNIVKKKKN